MSLTPGSRIGSYEVVAAVGAGGMGEVCVAHRIAGERPLARQQVVHHGAWSATRRGGCANGGTRLGFFADGKLQTIAVANGLPETIANAPAGRGGTWCNDDAIVFSPMAW